MCVPGLAQALRAQTHATAGWEYAHLVSAAVLSQCVRVAWRGGCATLMLLSCLFRRFCTMWAKGVGLVGVAAASIAGWLAIEGPGVCPHDPEACFFSENYLGARARFREHAARAGASLEVLRLSESPNLDLTIDVAVLPAAAGTAVADGPVLVHMSGTHGVEAYAGSAVQLALLRKWADEPHSSPASRGVKVVLVHVVNPYGFHCSRRFNEDNADLNRNVLSAPAFAELAHSDAARRKLYDDHSWLFNWARAWTPVADDLLFAAKALYGVAVIGMVNVKRAIVAGRACTGSEPPLSRSEPRSGHGRWRCVPKGPPQDS